MEDRKQKKARESASETKEKTFEEAAAADGADFSFFPFLLRKRVERESAQEQKNILFTLFDVNRKLNFSYKVDR